MNINWDLVLDCLGILVMGMVGIFAVILVIWALVALLNRITAPSASRRTTPEHRLCGALARPGPGKAKFGRN